MSLVRPLVTRRGFSTSSEKMVASVLFERLPVVIPKIDPVVYAFQEFSQVFLSTFIYFDIMLCLYILLYEFVDLHLQIRCRMKHPISSYHHLLYFYISPSNLALNLHLFRFFKRRIRNRNLSSGTQPYIFSDFLFTQLI